MKTLKSHTIVVTFAAILGPRSTFDGTRTGFEDSIPAGDKITTIRENYEYWANRIDRAQKHPDSICSHRMWSGKARRSLQYEINQVPAQDLWYASINFKKMSDEILLINDQEFPLDLVARNDGLGSPIFRDWFRSFENTDKPCIIIGWTSNPYLNHD